MRPRVAPGEDRRRHSGETRRLRVVRRALHRRSVGGEIRQSWCGPCFGQGPDALRKGEVAITSFNRNWQNRMGYGGEGYCTFTIASPTGEGLTMARHFSRERRCTLKDYFRIV